MQSGRQTVRRLIIFRRRPRPTCTPAILFWPYSYAGPSNFGHFARTLVTGSHNHVINTNEYLFTLAAATCRQITERDSETCSFAQSSLTYRSGHHTPVSISCHYAITSSTALLTSVVSWSQDPRLGDRWVTVFTRCSRSRAGARRIVTQWVCSGRRQSSDNDRHYKSLRSAPRCSVHCCQSTHRRLHSDHTWVSRVHLKVVVAN